MEFVLAVMSKYLQMMSAYSIYKEEPDEVAKHFEHFNEDYEEICKVFKELTSLEFKAGQEVKLLKPVAPVKPVPRESKSDCGLSDLERTKLQKFLETHGLQELLNLFLKEGVELDDVLQMTDEEMKELGIKSYKLRKSLLRATTGGASPASTTSPTLAESLQTSLQLGEAQNRFVQILWPLKIKSTGISL